MKSDNDQLELVRQICPEASLERENGKTVIFLRKMKFNSCSSTSTQDLLFVPFNHCGYPNRLFFKEILVGTEDKNWTEHIILNERWWSFSFRVDDDSTWKEKILQHLRGVSA